jgi:hypothetical protein
MVRCEGCEGCGRDAMTVVFGAGMWLGVADAPAHARHCRASLLCSRMFYQQRLDLVAHCDYYCYSYYY